MNTYCTICLILLHLLGDAQNAPVQTNNLRTGAEQTALYIPNLKGKKVGVVANHTSMIGQTHLVDSLLALGVNIVRVFAPEHGFRGDRGAGEHVQNDIDEKTHLPIISLYGKDKKPRAEWLKDLDVVLFDIQDVGARFYTYISTLHLVMETAAETKVEVVVLDRPNPNGWYTDGPVLDTAFRSFVGMDPIPIVHGCTMGEMAKMINGESWLGKNKQCLLKVITCEGYKHSLLYTPPIPPSPNLQEIDAIYLYPSLCWFEGTIVSVGRGTNTPFQVYGYPGKEEGNITFTPLSIEGVVKKPLYENKPCRGWNLQGSGQILTRGDTLALCWLLEAFHHYNRAEGPFFNVPKFFDKLAGTSDLREQIERGWNAADIRKSWEPGLKAYRAIRAKYLLYPD